RGMVRRPCHNRGGLRSGPWHGRETTPQPSTIVAWSETAPQRLAPAPRMNAVQPTSRWQERAGCGLAGYAALLGVLTLVHLAYALPPDELPDPLPLRRVPIPPERVAAEVERARQGVWVQLPRADFD